MTEKNSHTKTALRKKMKQLMTGTNFGTQTHTVTTHRKSRTMKQKQRRLKRNKMMTILEKKKQRKKQELPSKHQHHCKRQSIMKKSNIYKEWQQNISQHQQQTLMIYRKMKKMHIRNS